MNTRAQPSEVLHYDASHPCCETMASADLFPDLMRLEHNVENRGRIASIFVESTGIGTQKHRLQLDTAAWEDRVKHPNFRACYDLGMAKLSLQRDVMEL